MKNAKLPVIKKNNRKSMNKISNMLEAHVIKRVLPDLVSDYLGGVN